MRMNLKRSAGLAGLLILSACDANFHSIYRTTPSGTATPHSQVVITDAKQGITVMNYDDETDMFRVCAARSPDVFSALTTAFHGDASAEVFQKFAAAISGSGTSAESASAFGLRTQLTQSQMELLYQLCLNSLNGTLSPDQLATEIHRYQNTMVTMLAIEQVTGYARPSLVAPGGQSAVGSAEAIAKQQALVELQKTKEGTLKKAADDSKATLQKASDDSSAADLAAAPESAKTVSLKKDWDDTVKQSTDQSLTQAQRDAATAAIPAKQKAYDDQKKKSDPLEQAAKEKKELAGKAQAKADSDAAALKAQIAARELSEKTLAAMEKQIDVSSSTATAQFFSPPNSLTYTDSETAKAIAGAVVSLQREHLNQTFLMDECVRYVYHPESKLSDYLAAADRAIMFGADKARTEQAISAIQRAAATEDAARLQACTKHFEAIDKYRVDLLNASRTCTTKEAKLTDGTVVTETTCEMPEEVAFPAPPPAGAPSPL